MIIHATDSTTKKGVGQFAVQGIHEGKGQPFSLTWRRKKDIPLQVVLAFEVKGVAAVEVYKHVDAHMTDSSKQNKGFSAILKDLYSLDKPAGQLFYGTHNSWVQLSPE